MKLTRREFFAVGTALALSACGGSGDEAKGDETEEAEEAEGGNADEAAEEKETAEPEAEEPAEDTEEAADFDGTGLSETGDFTFYITSSGGTSEDGNIPKIVYKPGTMGVGIGVYVEGGDGTVCTVYIDGHKRKMMNAGHAEQFIQFEDDDTESGVHKVELVSDDGGQTVYRTSQYEIVLDN